LTLIGQKCLKITDINLSGCSKITPISIENLAQNCSNITSFNLNYIKVPVQVLGFKFPNLVEFYNNNLITEFHHMHIEKLLSNCPQLTNINAFDHYKQPVITNFGLNIFILTIYISERITLENIQTICVNSPQITELNILPNRLIYFSDTSVYFDMGLIIANNLRFLTKITVGVIKPYEHCIYQRKLLLLVSCQFKSISSIQLNVFNADLNCGGYVYSLCGIPNSDIQTVCDDFIINKIKLMKNNADEENTLWNELVRPKCDNLTHFDAQELTFYDFHECCKSLTTWRHCKINDEEFDKIVPLCTHLTTIHFSQCNLNNSSLISLFQNNSNLMDVYISQCFSMCDECLFALAESCHNLRSFSLHSSTLLTDTGVIAVIRNCHMIEYLSLKDCINITKETVRVALSFGGNLQSINVSGTSVSKHDVWWLRKFGGVNCGEDVVVQCE
jgi:hypothetical protein